MKIRFVAIIFSFFVSSGINAALAPVPLLIKDQSLSMSGLVNQSVTMEGASELHLTSATIPIDNTSSINFTSDNGWVIFENIRPDTVRARYLGRISVSGTAALVDGNIKVVQYINGTVIISRGKNFRPFFVFNAPDLGGSPDTFGVGLVTGGSPKLGRSIRSFLLRRGYLATFANNADGSGTSRVFVADTGDIAFNLPAELDGAVSLMRVADFRWAGKKGMGGGNQAQRAIFNLSAYYDWGNGGVQYPNTEYTPMIWGKNDSASFATVVANVAKRTDASHLLGFNEPDNATQSGAKGNLIMIDTAVANYRCLLRTGLRLGSPAVTDDANGWAWLDTFMTKTTQQGIRVDFIAIHYYQKSTPANLYGRISGLWKKWGRPIWLTEFNYGATWFTLPADSMEYYRGLKAYIDMLDTCRFVEHYFVYPWWAATDSVLSIFKTETPATQTYAGRWFVNKPDSYGYQSSLINNGIPIKTAVMKAAQKISRPAGTAVRASVQSQIVRCAFSLEESAIVSLELFSFDGKRVGRQIKGWFPAGKHEMVAEKHSGAASVNLFRLTCGPRSITGRMIFFDAGP
jgi:hypothetical protein